VVGCLREFQTGESGYRFHQLLLFRVPIKGSRIELTRSCQPAQLPWSHALPSTAPAQSARDACKDFDVREGKRTIRRIYEDISAGGQCFG
jgi:hypothetical protein